MQLGPVTAGVRSPSTILARARHWARTQPNKVCHTMLNGAGEIAAAMTYGELDRRANSVGAAVQALVPAASRVAIIVAGGPAFLQAYLGCLYAGCVAVPLPYPTTSNLALTSHLVDAMVLDIEAAAIVADAEFVGLLNVAGRRSLGNVAGLPTLNLSAIAEGSGSIAPEEFDDVTPAHILFTSGSTSAAKGVVLDLRLVAHNLQYTADRWGFSREGRHLTFAAPYHSAGLMVGYLMPLFQGASSFSINADVFAADPLLFIRLIERNCITLTACGDSAVERMIDALRRESIDGVDLSGWHTAVIGGEPLQQATLDEFLRLLRGGGFSPDRVMTAYGMTEAAGLITTTALGTGPRSIAVDLNALTRGRVVPVSGSSSSARSMVSSGQASHGVSVAIVDPDTLVERVPGELGELCYSSPSLFQGYFGRGSRPTETIIARDGSSRAGYFRSGDLAAIIDDDIFVAGRLRETISIGDRRIFPMDIEQCASNAHQELRRSRVIAFAGGDELERLVVAQEVPAPCLAIAKELRSAVLQALSARFGEDIDLEVLMVRPNSLPSVYTSAKKPRLRCREQYMAGGLCVVDAG